MRRPRSSVKRSLSVSLVFTSKSSTTRGLGGVRVFAVFFAVVGFTAAFVAVAGFATAGFAFTGAGALSAGGTPLGPAIDCAKNRARTSDTAPIDGVAQGGVVNFFRSSASSSQAARGES